MSTFRFFEKADVHDGEVQHICVADGTQSALRSRRHARRGRGRYPVGVELVVVQSDGRFAWKVKYSSVRRVLVDFPTDAPLFYAPGDGFGDWGYHELVDAGHGFLRHEVLFATGAVLLLEARRISVQRLRR